MLVAILIGITAWVYVDILTRGEMILGKLSQYLYEKLPLWLYKPIIGCSYCVAGQVALWYLILTKQFSFYSIILICISIFTVAIINKTMYGKP